MIFLLGCAAPWTLGSPPTEVVPPTEIHHAVPESDPHVVMAQPTDLGAFVRAWSRAGSPSLGIVILDANEGPARPTELEITGVTVFDGEVKTTSATLSTAPAPAVLPDTGWAGEVSQRLQEKLIALNVTVIDAAWADAGDGEGSDVTLEVKRVPEDLGPALQFRLVKRDGTVMAMKRKTVHGSSQDAWGRAAEVLLAELGAAL